jgi:hypothetical protein
MAPTSPALDNRTYKELKDELVGRIRVYAAEWTNYNESNPGIVLFGALRPPGGESPLYRFNQIRRRPRSSSSGCSVSAPAGAGNGIRTRCRLESAKLGIFRHLPRSLVIA